MTNEGVSFKMDHSDMVLGVAYLLLMKKRRLRNIATFGTNCAQQRKEINENFMNLLAVRRQAREEQKKRKFWVRPLLMQHDVHGAWKATIPIMRREDPEMFYTLFRMTPASFDSLLEVVGPHIQKKSKRKPISVGERLAITLRFLASGSSFQSLSFYFLVSEQVISNIILETCIAIWVCLQKQVFDDYSEELWLHKASEFETMWDIPHCVGAVDGKHIQIHAPPWSGSRFYNYKGFFSCILMAVCDAKMKFVMIDVGSSGRRGDGNVFQKSKFAEILSKNKLQLPKACPVGCISENLPFFFVGDAAFSRTSNMITPFKGTFLPTFKKVFNYRLSRGRRVIENAFGMLYKRYEVFQKPLQCSFVTSKTIVKACCALHNYHLMDKNSTHKNSDPIREKKVLERLQEEVSLGEVHEQKDLRDEQVTEALIDYFIEHDVPWQWKGARIACD